MKENFSQQLCPNCDTVLPVYSGYVTWCECGWNLQPFQPAAKRTLFHSIYESLGQKASLQKLQQMRTAKSLQPAMTFSKLLAYLIASIIHGFSAIWVIVGLLLLIKGWPNLLVSGFGIS